MRDGLHASHQRRSRTFVEGDGLLHERAVNLDATVVDLLVERIFFPDSVGDREFCEFLLDGLFDFDVALVVCLE